MLSDRQIREELDKGLEISGIDPGQVQPSSVDLQLDGTIVVLDASQVVEVDEEATYPTPSQTEDLILPPYGFALGQTKEVVEIPDYLEGEVKGRSSVGRLGLFVHNAGLIDPGYRGRITLELYNCVSWPLRLKEGMRVCQMTLNRMEEPAVDPYDGKYQGQERPKPSELYQDFE